MCFQGYVHWLCGHTSLYEEECPIATSLEVTFYLKVACPAYSITNRSPQRFCGKGTFYCAQTPDGMTLDRFHATCKAIQEDITRIESRVYGERGLRAHGQAIGNAILRNGGKKEDCENDERVKSVFEEAGMLVQHLKTLKSKELELKGIIENARVFSEQWANCYAGTRPLLASALPPGLYPPVLQGVGQTPRRFANMSGGVERQREMSIGQPWAVRQQNEQYFDLAHQTVPFNAVPPQAGKYPTIPHHAGKHQNGHLQAGTHQPEVKTWSAIALGASQAHVRREKQRKEKDLSPEKSSPPIRRSSRVRTKRVTYAESESDPISRTPSPEKSDATDMTFSPSKVAASDRRAQVGRSSTLVDKIGDWQKQEMTKILRESLRQDFPNYNGNSPFSSNPKQRQWNVNRYDVDARVPLQNLHAPAQKWKVNRYDSDLTIPAPDHQEALPKNTNYASLREGLSATHNLRPRSSPQVSDSEPQKRRLPAPPPAEALSASTKRMKLSFPDDNHTGYTPAPVLPPTAATMSVVDGNRDVVPVHEDVPVLEQGHEVDTEDESELSDIDWDVLGEGISTD